MCWCDPENRTPCCGKVGCHPKNCQVCGCELADNKGDHNSSCTMPQCAICGAWYKWGMFGQHKPNCEHTDFRIPSNTPTIPHKCPICEGRGIVAGGFYTSTGSTWSSGSISETCRACGGKGILWK